MLRQVLDGAASGGAQTEVFALNEMNLKGCQACMHCQTREGCAVKDDMQKIYKAINAADGVVIGSPVFMYQLSGQTKLFIDRLFPYLDVSKHVAKIRKPTVLVLSQGNPDAGVWEAVWDNARRALALLGFPVRETIVAGRGHVPGAVAGQSELMNRAKAAGLRLVQQSAEAWMN